METVTLNSSMNLTYQDGFRQLSAEEISQMNTTSGPPQFCISDPERHMIVAVAWKQVSGFQAFMLNARDVIKEMEKQIARATASLGYKKDKVFERDADGVRGMGFRYTYTVQEIDMCSEAYVFEKEKTFYYMYFYYREALIQEGRNTSEEILQSISWQ